MASTSVLLTEYCNMRCVYCLAKDQIRQGVSSASGLSFREISLKEAEVIMDYHERDGQKDFRILGGEPTLHPQFIPLLKRALGRGFHIVLFTNGLFNNAIADFFRRTPKEDISYIINVNSPENYTQAKWKILKHNLALLEGKKVALSLNIYKLAFNYRFILELAKEFKIKLFSVSVAMPGTNTDVRCLHPSRYRSLIPRLLQFARASAKLKIRWEWNCCLPQCVLKKNEIEQFCSLVDCPISYVCYTGLTIGPRFRTSMCLGTSGFSSVTMTDYPSLSKIREHFSGSYAVFRRIGGYDSCIDCVHIQKEECQGGCVGYIMDTFSKAG